MSTNALILEFGWAPGVSMETSMKVLEEARAIWGGWKKNGQIESVQELIVVTGNRNQRGALIVLGVSHAQMEALVVHPSWMQLGGKLGEAFTNLSNHRSVSMERAFSIGRPS